MLKFIIGLLFGCLSIQLVQAQVTGKAILVDEGRHAGIKVRFIAQTMTAKSDSTVTDSAGQYTLSLQGGIYRIDFSKEGYMPVVYKGKANHVVTTSSVLEEVKLFSWANVLKGQIRGVLKRGNYIVTENLVVPADKSLTIEPGTQLYLYKDVSIVANGILTAKGTESQKIRFSSFSTLIDKDSNEAWKGLEGAFLGKITAQHVEIENASIAFNGFRYVNVSQSIIKNGSAVLLVPEITGATTAILDGNEFIHVKTVASGGGRYVRLSCNKVVFQPYQSGMDPRFLLDSKADTALLLNNVVDYNHYTNATWWVSYTASKNTSKLSIYNNYVYNHSLITFDILSADGVDSPSISMENNTLSGQGFATNIHLKWLPFEIKNNVFNAEMLFADYVYVGAPHETRPTLHHNLYTKGFKKVPYQYGFGQLIGTDFKGDSIDSYYNIFDAPRFLNNKPPYFSRSSPALGSGIGNDQLPKNIGFDPSATCMEGFYAKETEILPGDTLSLSGKVHQGSGLLTDGVVMAISNHAPTQIGKVTNGNFTIQSLSKGEYTFYAIPNPMAVTAFLPTYYVKTIQREDARYINIMGDVQGVDMYLVPVSPSAAGAAKVNGRFGYASDITDDTTKFASFKFNQRAPSTSISLLANPCQNLPILLYNSDGQLVRWAITDANGYFSFEGLPAGRYFAYGQREGYYTEQDGQLDLVADGTYTGAFYMYPGKKVAGLKENGTGAKSNLAYPNPFTDRLYLQAVEGEPVLVSDATGVDFYSATHHREEPIDTEAWPSGVYFLRVGNHVQKVVK